MGLQPWNYGGKHICINQEKFTDKGCLYRFLDFPPQGALMASEACHLGNLATAGRKSDDVPFLRKVVWSGGETGINA
jgi:hypothetical protein